MKSTLQRARSVAVVTPTAIGDSLLMMVLVNNLIRNGYRPVVVSWVVADLAAWFPGVVVHAGHECAAQFDLVIQLRATDAGRALSIDGTVCELVQLPSFNEPEHMIDKLVGVAQHAFGLSYLTRHNGIALPPHIRFRLFEHRVAIHPTGSHAEKIWPRKKFAGLAEKLLQQGLNASFLVAPAEKSEWLADDAVASSVQSFAKLGDVAQWIAESGWFIGNDSGLGHLASALDVPTVSLFMRRGLARTWRPAWGRGAVVLPRNVFVSAYLKERFWKLGLSVQRVVQSFERLKTDKAASKAS
ncbi:glycosyltransferase family 9 protein [Paraburkholderia sp.]|uniref:glycosyltransferase family 9 protein n=1 Tax=Paraburkholderia sp. TaxID=1926495 RepID=UPI002386DEDD|nr:glycosyltransferase family 9 protein [Paraburkholderia sp.]MDE1179043.1 glycosyltransferase family 9 protein [Paraburkholderia sp.]